MNKIETLEDIKWVDTHCHLQLMGDEIDEQDISNLEYFIIPGVDVPSSLKAKKFSLEYPDISYWSAGLHPHEADSLEDIKNELNKPLIIHCRDSFSDVFDTLNSRDITNPIILHSWTGGNKWTKKFTELGVYFSISGIVTYDTAHDLQDAVKKIPIDKLLLETDVPYLAPEPFKGKGNNPTYIKYTGAKLAQLLGLTPHDLSKVTIANTNKVLNREK